MADKIWFHADDYGVTIEQSQRILDCWQKGALNSVSVLPNTLVLKEVLQLLDQADPEETQIRRVLHLNFVEGKPLAGAENVPDLVDRTGYFDKGFLQFLQWNYLKKGTKRRALIRQIQLEITAQLHAVTKKNDFKITAVDSHQHYHMRPIVFDSLIKVLSRKEFEHLKIRHIRIPVDPVMPLLHKIQMCRGIPPINWVKWCILKIYAKRTKRILNSRGIEAPVFFGIFYTCEMKKEVVEALLPLYKAYADKKGQELELMFHPGNLMDCSELLDKRSKELATFYLSDNRQDEAECLKRMKEIMKK